MPKRDVKNLKLKHDGDSGDGKRNFIVACDRDNSGDVRIEIDTDDVDSVRAKKAMRRIIACVNHFTGREVA